MEQIAIMNAKSESLPEAMQEIKLAANFHDYKDSNLDKKSSVTQIPAGETVVAEILPLSLHLPSLVWLDTTSCADEMSSGDRGKPGARRMQRLMMPSKN